MPFFAASATGSGARIQTTTLASRSRTENPTCTVWSHKLWKLQIHVQHRSLQRRLHIPARYLSSPVAWADQSPVYPRLCVSRLFCGPCWHASAPRKWLPESQPDLRWLWRGIPTLGLRWSRLQDCPYSFDREASAGDHEARRYHN